MKSQGEILQLYQHLQSVIVGQKRLLDRLLISVLTGRHLLLESPPGLAKTTAVKTLAEGVHASFQRIQFTPDLLPSDLTGSDVFDPKNGEFHFVNGPLFHEIILADEINRAPPKVQSALLEAMEEHQITVGGVTRALPELFIVMATQNPLEQAGTYPLPEAQLDRFMMHVLIDYPSKEEELEIMRRDRRQSTNAAPVALNTPLHPDTVIAARKEVAAIHVEAAVDEFVVSITDSTRHPGHYVDGWDEMIEVGASPRATLAMVRAGSAHAYLQGREFLMPEDIVEVAPDILRHRIIPSFTAQAQGLDAEALVQGLLAAIPRP
ncbi:MAG: MoxR family ATPase [Gammaproteobacteria bacterium]|nr:MoxR family ATPase [Gammaproteobacteria bacterium]